MKLQYLGDSRDSFKWHYHNFLVSNDSYSNTLGYIPLLRPDDDTGHGATDSSDYEADNEIQEFCLHLRNKRNIREIYRLPEYTNSDYKVSILKPDTIYSLDTRDEYYKSYFSAHIVLFDPCTGFAPNNPNNNHVIYKDLAYYIHTIPKCGVFSVYQHFRRKKFENDFTYIKHKIWREHPGLGVTAICWRSDVMFVQISLCIDRIREINQEYALQNKDVYVLN